MQSRTKIWESSCTTLLNLAALQQLWRMNPFKGIKPEKRSPWERICIEVMLKILVSLGPSFTMEIFFHHQMLVMCKRKQTQDKEKQLSHEGGWRTIVFFMKEYLLHNIHSNENKNQSKIKTQVVSITQCWFLFLFFNSWIRLKITFLLRNLFFFSPWVLFLL
jgi:hypothetical protein